MSEAIPSTSRPRRRRRWTSADKTRHLAAFAKSGLSINEFCAGAGVPRSSFILWQQQARTAAASFAQVEVVPAGAAAGITLVIRTGPDVVVELAGLDRAAAVMLLSTTLQHRRR